MPGDNTVLNEETYGGSSEVSMVRVSSDLKNKGDETEHGVPTTFVTESVEDEGDKRSTPLEGEEAVVAGFVGKRVNGEITGASGTKVASIAANGGESTTSTVSAYSRARPLNACIEIMEDLGELEFNDNSARKYAHTRTRRYMHSLTLTHTHAHAHA
jgi:hypothetical protein